MSERTDEELWSWIDRDDPELSRHLAAHPEDEPRVAGLRQVLTVAAAEPPATTGTRLPERIGPYAVTRLLGEGGMGVVYEARQANPERQVAVKVLRDAGHADERRRERFAAEAAVLALLRHPGVAAIYDAGETDEGRPYFVMELVRGEPLTVFAETRHLPRRERLELFARVCDAAHDAHSHGVIHRDLKPSNVLVDPEVGPKVLDFGLARVTQPERSLDLTRSETGVVLGTLAYMSPEQARGRVDDLDARTDVFSLGVILYELLTGELPRSLRGKPLHAAVREIAEGTIARPSSRDRSLRGDLDTIVCKALERDLVRRYASAAELAGDVRRHLDGRPILARAPSWGYRARKWARRHPVGTLALATIALLFVGVVSAAIFRVSPLNARTSEWLFGTRSPFEGLRWRGEIPEVRVNGEWSELLAIDGLTTAYVIGFCKQVDPRWWRKSFSEDLLQMLNRLGDWCVWDVDLQLRRLNDGRIVVVRDTPLLHENRQRIWRDRYDWPFDALARRGNEIRVTMEGREWSLVELDGTSDCDLLDGAARHGLSERDLFDVICDVAGRSPGETVSMKLRDPATGEERVLEGVSRVRTPRRKV